MFNLGRVESDIKVLSRLALICMVLVVDPLLTEINGGTKVVGRVRGIRVMLRELYKRHGVDVTENDWIKGEKFMSAIEAIGMNLILIQADIMKAISKLNKTHLVRLDDVRCGSDLIYPFVNMNRHVLEKVFPEALKYMIGLEDVPRIPPFAMDRGIRHLGSGVSRQDGYGDESL